MWIFYINCCVVVDDFLDKNKILNSKEQKARSEWKESRKDIKQIYYERDKNSAHSDENYRSTYYQSFKQLINEMKRQLKTVFDECRKSLLDEISHMTEYYLDLLIRSIVCMKKKLISQNMLIIKKNMQLVI